MERRFGDISVMAEVFGQLKAANVKVIIFSYHSSVELFSVLYIIQGY